MKNELKPYEVYKEVDLLWLDRVPKHWEMIRNKNILTLKKDTVGSNYINYKLLSLTKVGVIARDMINPKGKFPKEFDTYQVVRKNDIVFCLFDIDETPRTVGLSPIEGMITGAYTVFGTGNINVHYFYYYYLSLDNNKLLKPLYTGLRKVINVGTFLNTKMPFPPLDEQNQIVRYLDSQLVKIDKLLKAKKKQIELLKEQKQAIINQAVTKGLDPHAKMKPSGVEWLENIPEDWVIKPLKYLVRSNIETLTDSCDNNLEIDYIDISTVGFNHLKQKPVKYLFKNAPSRARRVIHTGDTIISTVRTYLKSMWYVSEQFDGFIASTGFAVLTPNEEVFPKLLNYILSADNFINRVNKYSIGVSYPAISETKLTNFKIALPLSIEEQSKILEYIIARTKIVDKTISKIDSEINLITEYRNSLITEVVTGKIDVRGIAVKEAITPELDEEFELDEEMEMEDFPESEE